MLKYFTKILFVRNHTYCNPFHYIYILLFIYMYDVEKHDVFYYLFFHRSQSMSYEFYSFANYSTKNKKRI